MRLWKLGSLEHGVWPSPASIERLASLLATGTVTDLVWGPDIEVQVIEDDDMDVIMSENKEHYIRGCQHE